MSLSVKEILNIGKNRLVDSNVADAAIDCKTLYCYLMKVTSVQIILEYQKILPDSLCDKYFELLDRRCSGVPVQYITGVQEFMGLEFDINENVLIPRQDTETMVEDAIGIIKENTLRGKTLPIKKKKDFDVLDLCCGSGAIGLSLANACGNIKVTCSDVSQEALKMAKQNAQKFFLDKRVNFEEGNLLVPFKGRFKNKKFDLIISNPPYVKTNVIHSLQTEVRDYEPMMALDGGLDGLSFYRNIVTDAVDYLKTEGILMLEIGHDQREEVLGLIEATGQFDYMDGLKDLAGRDRIIVATLANKKK